MQTCEDCAEKIKDKAKVCRYCGKKTPYYNELNPFTPLYNNEPIFDTEPVLQAETPLGMIIELIYWYFAVAFIISLPVTILAYFELTIYFAGYDMDFETGLFWVWWDVFKQSLTWLPDTLKWLWDILF